MYIHLLDVLENDSYYIYIEINSMPEFYYGVSYFPFLTRKEKKEREKRREKGRERDKHICVLFFAREPLESNIYICIVSAFTSIVRSLRWSEIDRQRSGEKVDRDKIIIVVTKP